MLGDSKQKFQELLGNKIQLEASKSIPLLIAINYFPVCILIMKHIQRC